MTEESTGVTAIDLAATAQKAQAGDRDAFTDLFMALHKPVLNYVFRTVGDRQVAEDVSQDAFIRAHARIDQLGPPWDFKSWVFRIAGNLAIDHLRRNKRFVDVEEPMELGGPPTTRRPAERGVQRHEAEEDVKKTLALMQTRYRQALILKEINNLSYKEISSTLECSYDNARQLVHRARLHFRELHGIRLLAESGATVCMELGNLVSAFRDGELDEAQQDAVKEHLAVCAHCQETEQDLKRVAGIFGFLPPVLPSSSWIAQSVERIQTQPPPPGAESPAGNMPPSSAAGAGQTAVKSAAASKWLIGGMAGLVGAGALIIAGGLALGLFGGGWFQPQPPDPADVQDTVAAVIDLTPPSATVSLSDEGDDPEGPEADLDDPAAAPLPLATTPPPPPPLGSPIAIALANSNCRGGPHTLYDVLGYLLVGERTPIRGRDEQMNWWVVDRTNGNGTCWVANSLTDEEGDLSQVPIIAAPPTPTPEDTTPPSVQISYSPAGTWKPDEDDSVTFSARASDDHAVQTITIYVQSPQQSGLQKVKTCSGTTTCEFQGGPYPAGTLHYRAAAVDQAGNSAETSISDLTIYAVVR